MWLLLECRTRADSGHQNFALPENCHMLGVLPLQSKHGPRSVYGVLNVLCVIRGLFTAVYEIDAVFRIFGPVYRDVDDSEKSFRFFECHDYATSAVKSLRVPCTLMAMDLAVPFDVPAQGRHRSQVGPRESATDWISFACIASRSDVTRNVRQPCERA